MANHTDRELGMHVPISRRDFLNGIAVGIGGASAAAWLPDLADAQLSAQSASYPPALTGLRGSHVGSFDVAHTLRDGSFWKQAGPPSDTGEVFDLVVVGGGISGLSAAHFFRARAGQSARILVLDNHDDFGGHAKRNEFHIRDRMLLMNGGTASINSPVPYSAEADGLLKTLGVNPEELSRKTTNRDVYRSQGLRRGMFFDRETFGADRLVVGVGQPDWSAYAARTPLSEQAQRDLVRMEEASVDYMPGLSSAEKKARLSKISYKNFLLTIVGVHPSVAAIYQARTHAEWGVGIEAESALDCWTHNLPGFQGMQLEDGSTPNMSYTAAGYADGGSYSYHFPDGNASIARLLVRSLVPDAVPGRTAEDVVTARVDYSKLDHSEASVRIRLNSTVVPRQTHRRPWFGQRGRGYLRNRRSAQDCARQRMCARMLDHDDPVSLSGTAAAPNRGAALLGESTVGLHKRGSEKLGIVPGARRRQRFVARDVPLVHETESGCRYRRL